MKLYDQVLELNSQGFLYIDYHAVVLKSLWTLLQVCWDYLKSWLEADQQD